MNYTDIESKELSELKTLLKEKKLELFESRIKLKTMQLKDTSQISKIKKEIAQINTAIGTKDKV